MRAVPKPSSLSEDAGATTAAQDSPDTRATLALRLNLALISFALAAYQIALTRVSSVLVYTQATFLILSVCVAAIGLGAAWVHWRLPRPAQGITLNRVRLLALLVGATTSLTWVLVVRVKFALTSGVFALPFLLAGACLAITYVWIGTRASMTYAFELAGGAGGVVVALLLLPAIGDVNTGLAAATAASLAALTISRRRARAIPCVLALAPAALLLLNLTVPGGVLAVDPYAVVTFEPHLVYQTGPHHGRVVATAYDDFARTDLVQTDEPWVRYLFTDRMYTARVVRWDGRSPRFDDAEPERLAAVKSLPFRNWHPRQVLILGSGGGFDVALAFQGGAARVTAVEINGASIRFTRELGAFSGSVYDRSEVTTVKGEARRFLRDAAQRWDLIQLSLLQSDPAQGRSNVARQNWVFTVEAMAAYLEHLNPDGAVAIVQNTEELASKTVATTLAAFQRLGISEAEAWQRIVVLAWTGENGIPFSHLVLVSPRPVPPLRVAQLLAGASPDITLRIAPGAPASEPYASLASGRTSLRAWLTTSEADLTPPTDDAPFFFTVERGAGTSYIRLGIACLALLVVLAAADCLRPGVAAGRLPVTGWAAGAALGLGFILLQAGLIHRAQFLLGTPTLAVALGVGGMFVGGSLGALLGVRLFGDAASSRLLAFASVTAVGIAAVMWLWQPAVQASHGKGDAELVLVIVVLFGLPAVAAGACFPAVIERWAGTRQRAAAAVYAADGVASVVGGALAAVAALRFGIRSLFLAAIACYIFCAVLALVAKRPPQKDPTLLPRG